VIATVRLDKELSDKLNTLSIKLKRKKSDIIREAIKLYAKETEKKYKSRLLKAVDKVKDADLKEYNSLEGTLNDGI